MTVNQALHELDSKLSGYAQILKKHDDLVKEQEEILLKNMEESKEIINWYLEQNFNFTHPTITEFKTSKGPILGYNRETNELIIWVVDKGIIKLNTRTREEKIAYARWLVENGYFNDAIAGLSYLEKMLDRYTEILQKQVTVMEQELSELK